VSLPIPNSLLAAPVLAALTFVMSVYVDRGQVLETLPRPLMAAALIVLAIQGLSLAITRRADVATAIALLAVVGLVDPRLPVLAIGFWLIARELARRRRWSVSWHVIRTPIAVLFVVTLGRLLLSPAFALQDVLPRVSAAQAGSGQTAPDIFLLLLDGYPRGDTLESFGYDNSWFEAELQSRGFSVARNSHTNYTFTYVVVPTLFHMRHAAEIDELQNAGDEWVAQRRAMRSAIASAPAFPLLEGLGYEIVTAGASGTPVSLRPVASELDGGALTYFERELLASTVVGRWFPSISLAQHRERVLDAFDAVAAVASDPGQSFMFAHVLSPHVPFVFDRQGELPEFACVDQCNRFGIYAHDSGMTREQFERAYTDQVDFLNHKILETLDRVIEASPNAPMVLFSDHGTRSEYEHSDEWFSTFFASRTPGHSGLFDDDARPLEILPVLLNEYFGKSLPVPRDESFYSPLRGSRPLYLVPWEGVPDGDGAR
jgi:hypothetical protein